MEHRITLNTRSSAYLNRTINIDSVTHGAITEKMLYSFPSRNHWDTQEVKIIWIDSSIYAFEQCRFNVLKWQDSMWVNLYNNNNKGWCINNFYLQDNSILGFTAEGFWTSQAALYQFEQKIANWEIKSAKNSPEYYASGGDFRIGEDTIISTWGTTIIQGELEIRELLSTYGLCLKTNSWFKVTNNIELKTLASTAWGGITFDFENEVLIVRNNQIVQIDKKSKNVYLFKGDKLKHGQIDFYYNDCNRAIILQDGNYYSESPKPIEKLTPLGKISFESIHEKVEEESITANKKKSYLSNTIILIAMLLIGIIIWIVKFKKSKFNNQELLKQIKQQSGNLLNSNEIDVILGINSSMSQDSKRVKRSRIIKSINEEYILKKGKKLITRQRDENDNRYMLYKIKK
jgi:hypothetical protein